MPGASGGGSSWQKPQRGRTLVVIPVVASAQYVDNRQLPLMYEILPSAWTCVSTYAATAALVVFQSLLALEFRVEGLWLMRVALIIGSPKFEDLLALCTKIKVLRPCPRWQVGAVTQRSGLPNKSPFRITEFLGVYFGLIAILAPP